MLVVQAGNRTANHLRPQVAAMVAARAARTARAAIAAWRHRAAVRAAQAQLVAQARSRHAQLLAGQALRCWHQWTHMRQVLPTKPRQRHGAATPS